MCEHFGGLWLFEIDMIKHGQVRLEGKLIRGFLGRFGVPPFWMGHHVHEGGCNMWLARSSDVVAGSEIWRVHVQHDTLDHFPSVMALPELERWSSDSEDAFAGLVEPAVYREQTEDGSELSFAYVDLLRQFLDV